MSYLVVFVAGAWAYYAVSVFVYPKVKEALANYFEKNNINILL